jgi:hypothetical protein
MALAMPVDAPDARDAVHPCRPTISCTADIVAPGRMEVELGAQAYGPSVASSTFGVPFLLKQSLTHLVQIQLGSNGYTRLAGPPSTRYVDDFFFGPKLHLVDQGDVVPSIAVSAQLAVPVSHAEGYAPHDDAFATAYASKDLGPLHADANVGVLVWCLDSTTSTQVFTALALSVALPAPFGATVEAYYFSDAAPLAPRDGGARAYVGLSPRPWLAFDVGGDAGFFPSTRAFTAFLGMTVIPVVWWRPAGEEVP